MSDGPFSYEGQPPAGPPAGAPEPHAGAAGQPGAPMQPGGYPPGGFPNYPAPTGQPMQPFGQPAPPFATSGPAIGISLWLSLAGTICVLLATFVKEDNTNFWERSGEAWAIFAIVAALVTAFPVVKGSLAAAKAWMIAAVGAGGLFAWWVLVALPGIGTNLGFLATAGTALCGAAVWLDDGRPSPPSDQPPKVW